MSSFSPFSMVKLRSCPQNQKRTKKRLKLYFSEKYYPFPSLGGIISITKSDECFYSV
ncbi:hypothetical protein GCWU000341_00075 [Oribacterium sp. oral taxon 078 str. F0262]|nr:hypothetical protein GCWU000341_00075 [Oribacterium sp. oral taxon 078 str. F0262]